MRLLHCAALLLLLACACATTGVNEQERLHPIYREKIQEWQMRIQREGWSENQVHSILSAFRTLATYRMEIQDHWDTPGDFINRGFAGDCEDIVVFMIGTLKRLGYPYGLRVLIAHDLFEDHALLRIEMPEGRWKVYDVVPRKVSSRALQHLKPVVEFDEKRVDWFPSREGQAHDAGNTRPITAGRN